jgi:hypothetical protein
MLRARCTPNRVVNTVKQVFRQKADIMQGYTLSLQFCSRRMSPDRGPVVDASVDGEDPVQGPMRSISADC